jgi:hypothetical protein
VRAFLAFVALTAVAFAGDPIWSPPAGFPPTLRDIASRLPPDTPAKEPDLITYGHEGSHFLTRFRPGEHGLYALRGRWEWVPIPPIRTADLFARIPPDERGTIYETYRRQGVSEGWANRPTMVLDEWVAYLRGSQIRRELSLQVRGETNRHAMSMARYSRTLYKMSREVKGYDYSRLRDFCRWTLSECREAIPEWDTTIRFEP